MERRRYLRRVGAGTAFALAGCLDLTSEDGTDGPSPTTAVETPQTVTDTGTATPGPTVSETLSPVPETTASEGTPTPTLTALPSATPLPTPTATPTPTPTPTEEPGDPALTDVSLVTHWEQSGDIEANAINKIGEGGYAVVAIRFEVWSGEGDIDVRAEGTVTDSGGNEFGTAQRETTAAADPEQYVTYEWALEFDSTDWAQDAYTVSVVVTDQRAEISTQPATDEFQIDPPLSGSEATYVRYQGPRPVTAGKPFSFEVEVRNEVSRDSTVVSDIEERQIGGEWRTLDDSVNLNVAGGETNTFGREWTVEAAGDWQWRLTEVDVEWSLTAEAPQTEES